MKIKTIFFAFLFTLINLSVTIAAPGPANAPPAPTAQGTAPPNPPNTDINQNILFLLVAALIFGAYTIYRYNLKRKASM